MTFRLHIDTAECTGHGRCYVKAPELFADDESGFGRLIDEGAVPEHLLERARAAVTACPERAISLIES